MTLHAPRVCWWVQLRPIVDLLGPGVKVLQGWSPPGPAWGLVTRPSYRGAVGSGAFLGFQGPREVGPGSLRRAEARGSVVVGVLESSSVSSGAGQSMPSSETLLEEQKWQEGTLPVPGFGPLEEAIVWGAMNKGVGGSLKKGFSGHPEVVFGALGAKEVTSPTAGASSVPSSALGSVPICPHLFGPLCHHQLSPLPLSGMLLNAPVGLKSGTGHLLKFPF